MFGGGLDMVGDAERMVGELGFWWWWCGFWWWRCGGGGKTTMTRTRNSIDQDTTTSTRHDDADTNSAMQRLKRKDAKARTGCRTG